MRVQKLLARTKPGEGHREANEPRAKKCAENLTSRVMRHDENCGRHGDIFAPSGKLEADALLILGE